MTFTASQLHTQSTFLHIHMHVWRILYIQLHTYSAAQNEVPPSRWAASIAEAGRLHNTLPVYDDKHTYILLVPTVTDFICCWH